MNWCNFCFMTAGRDIKIENLETDFENGLKLIYLVEVLTGEQLTGYNDKPRLRIQKANNINIALKKIKDEGVNVTCGAEGRFNFFFFFLRFLKLKLFFSSLQISPTAISSSFSVSFGF